jgi:hypothetical protein
MARKLKTYVTSVGFFEQAVAAPSMKAALKAWGSGRNLFEQGFAKETDDAAIIDATMKQPGVVLKRPVGSDSRFKIHAELPKADFLNKQFSDKSKDKPKTAKTHSAKASKKALERELKAAQAYERKEKKAAALRKKHEKRRQAELMKAELDLSKAEKIRERKIRALENQQAAINQKREAEETAWNNEKRKLEAAIDKLKQ